MCTDIRYTSNTQYKPLCHKQRFVLCIQINGLYLVYVFFLTLSYGLSQSVFHLFLGVLNDDKGIGFNLLFEDDGFQNDDDGNLSDDISIAALKEIKKKHITDKANTLKDLDALNQFLTLGNFKVKDIVK